MPPNPLAKRMDSPCAACRFATCKFSNLKHNSGPPLPNLGHAPAVSDGFTASSCDVGLQLSVIHIGGWESEKLISNTST